MEKVFEALKTIKIKCHPNSNPSPIIDEALLIVEQNLQRLEAIDNAKPSEALEDLKNIALSDLDSIPATAIPMCEKYNEKVMKDYNTIKHALIKAQEQEEKYVIYCINNYHNIYMDYRGEPCNYEAATIFNNKVEAHKFLREKGNDDYYYWSVFNIKDLSEDRKHRRD